MITGLCDKHQVVIASAKDPEQAFRRLLTRAMVGSEDLRRAAAEGNIEKFEPVCCFVGDAAVTDAKLDRPGEPDPALDPKLIPIADKLKPSEAVEAEEK